MPRLCIHYTFSTKMICRDIGRKVTHNHKNVGSLYWKHLELGQHKNDLLKAQITNSEREVKPLKRQARTLSWDIFHWNGLSIVPVMIFLFIILVKINA